MDRPDTLDGMVDQFNGVLGKMERLWSEQNAARENVSRCADELRELRKAIYASVAECIGPEEKETVIPKPDYPRAGVGG